MDKSLSKFNQLVLNKYNLYNGLFMSLPYEKISNIGMLIPILENLSRTGFENGETPIEIIEKFFNRYTEMQTREERLSFLFRVIQYVERQVVLFDSIEDAAFKDLHVVDGQNNSLDDQYKICKNNGSIAEFRKAINELGVRIVFTAHPTQFYPPSVQTILHDLKDAITAGDLNTIDLLLQQLGQTPFINKEKPTPYEEASSIVYYLRNVYYKTIGDMVSNFSAKYFDKKEDFANHQLIQLGFWPGGDRDGNPFVTYDTTMEVSILLRTTLMKCYYNELKELRKRLTFRDIEDTLQILSDKLYAVMFTGKKHLSYEEIISPLLDVRQRLVENYHSLFLDRLDALIDRVKIFKTHFASLDIRQDGPKHAEVLKEILDKYQSYEQYEAADESGKIEMLLNPSFIANPDDFEGLTKETLLNVSQIKTIQAANGELGCHRYIISNSESIYDVLTVYFLFKVCGYADEDIRIDIMPLFETIKGLSNAENTMQTLYQLPQYAQHLRRRGEKQGIMLGFSDGTKDGGYLKANWEIFRTKETLSKVSEKEGIKVVFFDGRGGPPARGGGKTHRFYASQGKNIAPHEIQLTIQGQTISSMYGNYDQFYYNAEQIIIAGVNNKIADHPSTKLDANQRKLMDELGQSSYEFYSELKAHPQFLPYLENVSTLKYYGMANIGSRPGKRGNKKQLEFSDLRAISFVGSWSQLKQNVPGYFGIGTALQKLKNEKRLDEVKDLFKSSAFFRTLLLNSMMSLEKSYFPLTKYIKDNPEYTEFWNILHQEYELSKAMLLEVSDFKVLMEREPLSKASIGIRDRIVLPLLAIQQYALQQIMQEAEPRSTYEMMVMRSLFGNINASRNSA